MLQGVGGCPISSKHSSLRYGPRLALGETASSLEVLLQFWRLVMVLAGRVLLGEARLVPFSILLQPFLQLLPLLFQLQHSFLRS